MIRLPDGTSSPEPLRDLCRQILGFMADGVLVFDRDGRITYSNPAAQDLLGLPAGEQERGDWATVADPQLVAYVGRLLDGHDQGLTEPVKCVIVNPKGSPCTVQLTGTLFTIQAGESVAGLLVIRDVSEVEVARKTLQQTQESCRAITENVRDGILVALRDGRHVFANAAAAEITGYSVPELLEIDMARLADPDEVSHLTVRLKSRTAGLPEPARYRTTIVRKDGEPLPVEVSAALADWRGQRASVLTVRDIDQRVAAEKALLESEERLRELNVSLEAQVGHRTAELAQALLRMEHVYAIAEQVNSAERVEQQLSAVVRGCVDRLGFDFALLAPYDSEAAAFSRVVTYPTDERLDRVRKLTGVDVCDLRWPYVPRLNAVFDRLMAGETSCSQSLAPLLSPPLSAKGLAAAASIHEAATYLCVPLVADEGIVGQLFLQTERPVVSQQERHAVELVAGQASRAIERSRFVARLQAWSAELEATLAELRFTQDHLVRAERLAAVSELAAEVAHDLRNPLAVISSSAQILEGQISLHDPELRPVMDRLLRQVKVADDLMHDLLDYARLNPPQRGSTNPNWWLAQVIEQVTVPGGITVVWSLADGLPPVPADMQQMIRALRNLVQNAIQAMPDGGELTLRTWAEPSAGESGPKVCVSVSDTGQGVSESDFARLFEPLFSTRAQGLGLGLTMCRQVVARHGGALTAESNPNGGMTFVVRLPVDVRDGLKFGDSDH
jgi:PAS domain S-box-containing protein